MSRGPESNAETEEINQNRLARRRKEHPDRPEDDDGD